MVCVCKSPYITSKIVTDGRQAKNRTFKHATSITTTKSMPKIRCNSQNVLMRWRWRWWACAVQVKYGGYDSNKIHANYMKFRLLAAFVVTHWRQHIQNMYHMLSPHRITFIALAAVICSDCFELFFFSILFGDAILSVDNDSKRFYHWNCVLESCDPIKFGNNFSRHSNQ